MADAVGALESIRSAILRGLTAWEKMQHEQHRVLSLDPTGILFYRHILSVTDSTRVGQLLWGQVSQ
jgi:hypothetical protein